MYNLYLQKIDAKSNFETLAGRSGFKARSRGNKILITNSKRKTYKVDETLFNQVKKRYNDLQKDLRHVSSEFTDPKWKNCPNRVASVYVAAILKEIL